MYVSIAKKLMFENEKPYLAEIKNKNALIFP